ncbi:hypothetical protein [Lysobacter sp. P5_B9]
MRSTPIWAGIVALGCAFGAWAAEPGAKPPAQWAEYLAAVRKADAIVDDEARCLAHPDLPGNDWRPDAAKWRCAMLRKPMLSLDEIDQALQTDDGTSAMERRFAQLLDAHYQDQQQREQIFNAFNPFDDSARAGEVAKRWLERSPKSAFANMAMANYHSATGWEARGTKYAQETPQAQLKRMTDEFALAVPLYLKALEIEPRLSPACTSMAAIGRQSSDALQSYAMDVCTKADPNSYYLALERIYGAQPKWGGSGEALRSAVAYAEARIQANPILATLLGHFAGYGPSNAGNFGDVADELAAAARMAPSGTFAAHAGRGYRVKGDDWASLVYLSQALRFFPRDADWRYERAGLLRDVGDYGWASSDMKVALEVAPDDGWNQYRMGQIARELSGEGGARPYFKRAMEDPEARESAMALYCQSFIIESKPKEAGDCTRNFATEFPNNGEAWRLRSWVLEKAGAADADLEAAYDNFFRYADPKSELHQREVAELKQWRRMKKTDKPGVRRP